MALARSSAALLCVIALLLVADVAVAAQPELPQQQTAQVAAGSTKQSYLRGEVMSKLAENETEEEESLESFERRELVSDYGKTSSKPNCSGHCK